MLLALPVGELPDALAGFGPRLAFLVAPLLFGVCLQSIRMAPDDLWAAKAIGVALAAIPVSFVAGLPGTARLWRGGVAVGIALFPKSLLDPVLNPGGWLLGAHAKIGGFLLYSLGREVRVLGTVLHLPAGTLRVEAPCSGFALMVMLLKMAAIVSIALPIRRTARLTMIVSALGVGMAVGVLRVAVLASVAGNAGRFEFLHGEGGGWLFPTVAFLGYAPFLIPAEAALAQALHRLHEAWRRSVREVGGSGPVLLAVGLGVLSPWVFYVQQGVRDPFAGALSRNTPQGDQWEAIPGPVARVGVPFAAAGPAFRRTFKRDGVGWTVIFCDLAGAREGPWEMLQTPEIGEFARRELAGALPWEWKPAAPGSSVPQSGIIGSSRAALGVFGLDARGRRFTNTAEYLATQAAALKDARIWRDWLLSGRRLRDTRYRLVIVAARRDFREQACFWRVRPLN